MSGLIICSLLCALFTACSCDNNSEELLVKNSIRIIKFSGYDWAVRSSEDKKQGPGHNYFSDSEENVWVDDEGRLHLTNVKKNGRWN